MKNSTVTGAVSHMVTVDEPLIASADLLASWAPSDCRGGWVGDGRCDWYHGSWQYLRLVDLVPNPRWHHRFYLSQVRQALADGHTRALVSGTADYGMYAYLLAADPGAAPLAVTVVDSCPTPLRACRWYARRRSGHGAGADLETVVQDIRLLSAQRTGRYDLICADAFLTRFNPTVVDDVLAAWSALLRPGGLVVTTVRIDVPAVSPNDPEQARIFAETATQRWTGPLRQTRPTPAEIGRRAAEYAERMVSFPVGAPDPVLAALARHFTIAYAGVEPVTGGLRPVRYLRAVLRKGRA